MQAIKSPAKELVITRIFDAPRELAWKAWTDPERVKMWWGPKSFTAPACKIDLRVGGAYLYCMRSPEGRDYWSTGVYREIIPLERIVATDSFADEKGNAVPASHYGMPGDWPSELLVTVTFEEVNGKTKMTLRHAGIPAGEMSDMAGEGWNGSFDKLAEHLAKAQTAMTLTLPSDRDIVLRRVFNAPRELVWKAYTDPKLIPQWWGRRNHTTTVDKMDVRPGGVWRYVERTSDGSEYAFNGVYREVTPPQRIVSTFEYEGMPGHVALETATFEEHDGKTELTATDLFQTVEDRDATLQSGMEAGAAETWDRLAELLATLERGKVRAHKK